MLGGAGRESKERVKKRVSDRLDELPTRILILRPLIKSLTMHDA